MAIYLVNDGCGFIGSHLYAALLGRGDRVCVLDNLSTGSQSKLPPRAAFIEGNVGDATLVRQDLADLDVCFHLAAVSSVETGNRDLIGSHRTNLTGGSRSSMRQKRPWSRWQWLHRADHLHAPCLIPASL